MSDHPQICAPVGGLPVGHYVYSVEFDWNGKEAKIDGPALVPSRLPPEKSKPTVSADFGGVVFIVIAIYAAGHLLAWLRRIGESRPAHQDED